MSEEVNSNENDNTCVVCFKNVDIYSVGTCNHAVCFECSTRMRVLCRQNECPICRQDLPKVVFTKGKMPYSELLENFKGTNLCDRKFGIIFANVDIQKAYYKILEHRCQTCEDSDKKWPFKTFIQLKDHMRREHGLFYCEICVDNLKIFTFERRCYTRQELAHHRRKGDRDNTSHRGHPLCEFCDTRYVDNDELFRHLRRQHFFCHFCDADGKHQYYFNVDELRQHFADEHYLCEEGECKTNPLTGVFRSDIDLKAHIATEHSRHLSKSATKQARTLELEFTIAPRSSRVDNGRYKKRDRFENENYNDDSEGTSVSDDRNFIASVTPEDFPALTRTTSSSVILRTGPSTNLKLTSRVASSKFTQEDFPSLGGLKASAIPPSSGPKKSSVLHEPKNTPQISAKSKDDFPVLGSNRPGSSSTVRLSVSSRDPNAPNLSIQVDHQQNGSITTHITTTSPKTSEAFPALGNATELSKPQWIPVKSKNVELQQTPKLTTQQSSNSLDEFPSLLGNTKKGSATFSKDSIWVNRNANSNQNNTLDKSKQETKDVKMKNKKKTNEPDIESYSNKQEPNKNLKLTKTESTDSNDNVKDKNGFTNDISSTKPPPGFNVKPPPGLSPSTFPSLNSIANDLTFTSSSGQSYSITPRITYHPPNSFQARNHKLIQKVMQILNKDTIKEFKTYSDLFRNGGFPVRNYYEHCRSVLGGSFDDIFPELLVLLPDVQKQQELYKIYDGKGKKNLVVCENCNQIIYNRELSEHYNYHTLERQFPTLGSNQKPVHNAWR